MIISVSAVVLLGVLVWLLVRYAGLRLWHAVVCVLFGFLLAYTTAAPQVRSVIHAIIRSVPGHG